MFGVKSFGEESNSRSLINVRRSLNFDEVIKKPRETKPDRCQNGKRRLSIAHRRLHFGETEPSVLLRCPDLLPNRDAADPTTNSSESFRVKRTCLTFEQRTALEDLFQRKKFINMNEKVELAIELGVTKLEIQMWFEKRRQQWKKQHKEGLAVDSTRLCTLQANPQTPFPRPFQNVIICVATATAQSSSDVPDSLPDYLPRGREFLNPSADNKFLLFTPERVTYKAKRIMCSRLE